MNLGSNRYRASLIREDAYFSEVDQILLANLREALELQQEAARAAGDCSECESLSSNLQVDAFGTAELQRAGF